MGGAVLLLPRLLVPRRLPRKPRRAATLVPGTHSAAAGSAHARVQLVAWIVEVPVDSAWPIGALVCLAIARGWARGRLARVTKALVWIGCVVLLLRGGSGVLDDVTRTTGLLPNGITGLSLEATTGHTHLRWADWTIDGYFLAGGIIFWLLATLHRKQPTHPRSRRGPGSVGGVAQERACRSHRVRNITRRCPRTPRRSNPSGSGRCLPGPKRVAHVIPLLVLPSALWRWAAASAFPWAC